MTNITSDGEPTPLPQANLRGLQFSERTFSGQLNPALASRFNVNRTVDGATPTRRAISLSPTPAVVKRSTSRTWRIVVLSAGIRSPVQKPKERTLIGPAERRLTAREPPGLPGEII